MAALEHLSDTARENGDEHAPRYNAILKQTRGLFGHQTRPANTLEAPWN